MRKRSLVSRCCFCLTVVVSVSAVRAQTGVKNSQVSDEEKLVGAWHLTHIDSPSPGGESAPAPRGMLIYTRDGHVSVQLMYPKAAKDLSDEYVLNGYEASFGSYDVDPASHTLTHHIQGANTGDRLVGKDLRRLYQITPDGHLVIRSASAEEHWAVTWEHY